MAPINKGRIRKLYNDLERLVRFIGFGVGAPDPTKSWPGSQDFQDAIKTLKTIDADNYKFIAFINDNDDAQPLTYNETGSLLALLLLNDLQASIGKGHFVALYISYPTPPYPTGGPNAQQLHKANEIATMAASIEEQVSSLRSDANALYMRYLNEVFGVKKTLA